MKNNPKTTQIEPGYETPKFWWLREWVEYLDEITSVTEQLNFARSIANYGLFGDEPYRLTGEELEYFNEAVRPVLDEQRKCIKEGKRWRPKRK